MVDKTEGLHHKLALAEDSSGPGQSAPAPPAGPSGQTPSQSSQKPPAAAPPPGAAAASPSPPAQRQKPKQARPMTGKVIVKSQGRDQKKMLLLAAGLAVALVVILLWSGGYLGNQQVPEIAQAAEAATRTKAVIEWSPPPPMPQFLRDPMRFAAAGSAAFAGELALTGIIWNRESAAAVINGEVVLVGDEVYGARITLIAPDYVEYQGADGLERMYVKTLHDNKDAENNITPAEHKTAD